MLTADNLLERFTAAPYENLTNEHAAELIREQGLAEVLPDGEATIDVSIESGSPQRKKIVVEIAWQPTPGGPPSRHAVATWVYRAEGEE